MNAAEHNGDLPWYIAAAEGVAAALVPQIRATPGTVVIIPLVGFAEQSSDVIGPTLYELARQGGEDVCVLLLINRPGRRAADDTVADVHRHLARLAAGGVQFAVAEIVTPRRPCIGELRQLAVEALVRACPDLPADAAVIVADDDMVSAPPDMLAALGAAVRGHGGARLAVGPVLFDDPYGRAPFLLDFFLSDALRALLAMAWLTELSKRMIPRAQLLWHLEAMVLSGYLAVRRDALAAAGGFRPLNEITNLARDVIDTGRADTALRPLWTPPGGPALAELYAASLRLSARRALHAYHAAGVPSVNQWRTRRFLASRPDPVRTQRLPEILERPITVLTPHERRQTLASTQRMLAATLDAFPPGEEVARECLAGLGLDANSYTCRPPSAPGGRWQLILQRPDAMLDCAHDLQQQLLEDVREEVGPARPSPVEVT